MNFQVESIFKSFNTNTLSQINQYVLQLKGKDVLGVLAALGSTYLAYKTIKIYLHTRRYQHIPGAPIEGCFYFLPNQNNLGNQSNF
jgi:hypothetical protein